MRVCRISSRSAGWSSTSTTVRLVSISMLAGSARPAARQHDGHRLQNELEVVRQRPMVDVLHVEIHPLFERRLVSAADLPDACEAGPDRKPAPLPSLVLGDLRRNRGPR